MNDSAHIYNPWSGVARLFAGSPKPLEHRGSVDELTGWKVARVVCPRSGKFAGLAFGEYGMSQVARCQFDREHLPPVVGCECGFHALTSRGHAMSLLSGRRAGMVLLRVELYGTAVIHRDGLRAEEQEVVEVLLPATCSRLGCRRATIGLNPKRRRWVPVCGCHASTGTVAMAEIHACLGVDVSLMGETEHPERGN